MDETEAKDDDATTPISTLWGAATDWSLIQRAGGRDGAEECDKAWDELVRRYEYPIRVCTRHRLSHRLRQADVENGVSAFLSYLFEHGLLARADAARGRFRAYVQGIMNNWVMAYCRSVLGGGKTQPIKLEDIDKAVVDDTPDAVARDEQIWASHVLRRAVEALARGNRDTVSLLARAYGLDPEPQRTRVDLAAEEGIEVNALNVRLFHARKQFKALLLDELRQTCADDAEWESEQNAIIARLRTAYPRLFVDLEQGAP